MHVLSLLIPLQEQQYFLSYIKTIIVQLHKDIEKENSVQSFPESQKFNPNHGLHPRVKNLITK